jgi:two-component system chemotaxis response regulator CheY
LVTLLLVDDSDYIRQSLKNLLKEGDFNVIGEANNAKKAITEYKRLHPDVVLMDIVLESSETGQTGLDALKEILTFDPSAKILICSALTEQILIKEAMIAGAKGYISKPFEVEKLFETIINTSDLGIIAEIGNIAVGRAVTTLSKLINQPLEIDVPKIETTSTHLVSLIKWSPDQPVTAVHMGSRGQNECDILLAFELEEAKKFSEFLTEKIKKPDAITLDSAITEMSSITICSFLSAISDFLEIKLVPFGPTLAKDFFNVTLDSFLSKMTVSKQLAVLFDIRVKKQRSTVNAVLAIFLNPEFLKKIISSGKQWLNPEKNLEQIKID